MAQPPDYEAIAAGFSQRIRSMGWRDPRLKDIVTELRGILFPIPKNYAEMPRRWDWCAMSYTDLLMRLGRFNEAEAFLFPLVSETGCLDWSCKAHGTYATSLNKQKKYPATINWLKPRLVDEQLLAKDKYAHIVYGTALINSRQAVEAIKFLEPLVAPGGLLEHDPYGYTVLADAYNKNGEPEKAVALIKPLLAPGGILEKDPVSHSTHAFSLILAGRPEEAIAALEPFMFPHLSTRTADEFAEFNLGHDPATNTILANAYTSSGQPEKAIALLEKAVESGGFLRNSAQSHTQYAKALSAAGKKYKAMEWLRHRVAKRGILANNSVGHRLFAELCIEDNRLAEARESLDGLPPWYRDSGAYFTMARVEICSHRIGKA
ncbi:MAG: tetratricopeptide repeat protein, partial [Chitinophagia bacterium]|nr:tetratricopeptide repeat protein [Chitinophagia bacterium]